jgi:hypothetical protein
MLANQFKALLSILSLVAAGSVAAAAHATSVSNVRLVSIEVTGTSFAILTIDTSVGGRPSCHWPLAEAQYSFDVSTNKGKALLQIAQGAFLANKKIQITGGTTCVGGIEGVTAMRVYAQ